MGNYRHLETEGVEVGGAGYRAVLVEGYAHGAEVVFEIVIPNKT